MISLSLVDYADMGRIDGRILDDLHTPSLSIKRTIGSITSYFPTSMVIHPGFNDHLRIRNIIHGNMLSLSLKK